ncbi:MAG: tetratricopeptide repeat protein, partial [Gemmatimonadota bacterium]
AGSDAHAWFLGMKPRCNTVEVETALRSSAPPQGWEGQGFAAACLALAGRTDDARERLAGLDADARWRAAGIVFDIGHPVADAGDDISAAPIMELVVEFWPNHYMALYHAGAARFELGQLAAARPYLESFLREYGVEDGWTGSARRMLEEMEP